MGAHEIESDAAQGTEQLAIELLRLRADAGNPSYAEIAAGVAGLRAHRGLPPAASRVARSTVYDVFRAGRTRRNPDLVADIAVVLGATDTEAAEWRRRCRVAGLGLPTDDVSAPPAHTQPSPKREPAAMNTRMRQDRRLISVLFVLGVVGVAVVANVAGTALVLVLSLPFYLDMVGTAIAAIVFGPWYGVAAAIVTHTLVAATRSSTDGVLFTLVNVAGALLWGYGVRSWGLGRTPFRFLGLNVLVAVVCTLIAAPITLVAYQGVSPNGGATGLAEQLVGAGAGILLAVVGSNLITSIADKLIAGFVALAVAPALMAFRDRVTGRTAVDADLFRLGSTLDRAVQR